MEINLFISPTQKLTTPTYGVHDTSKLHLRHFPSLGPQRKKLSRKLNDLPILLKRYDGYDLTFRSRVTHLRSQVS